MLKHVCGQCQKIYDTEKDYLRHLCQSTGLSPTQSQNPKPAPTAKLSEKALLSAVRQARRALHQHG